MTNNPTPSTAIAEIREALFTAKKWLEPLKDCYDLESALTHLAALEQLQRENERLRESANDLLDYIGKTAGDHEGAMLVIKGSEIVTTGLTVRLQKLQSLCLEQALGKPESEG